jgi:RES domain-containing protein
LKAWRIEKQKRVGSANTGEGARITGGRWNSAGLAVVYASEHLSLAVLEILVHAPDVSQRQVARAVAAITIPDDLIEVVSPRLLPRGFGPATPLSVTQLIGDEWIRSKRTAILMVPSAIVTTEHNVLLNPLHPDFGRSAWSSFDPIQLDLRLWSVP